MSTLWVPVVHKKLISSYSASMSVNSYTDWWAVAPNTAGKPYLLRVMQVYKESILQKFLRQH